MTTHVTAAPALMLRAMLDRGIPVEGEILVVARRDIPGLGALLAVETAGRLTVGIVPARGEPKVWLLSLAFDEVPALSRLVAAANARLDDQEPPVPDEDEMTVLAEVPLGNGEVLRAVFMDADSYEGAGFALWRVERADTPEPVFTHDVVAIGLPHASELCNLVAEAALGRTQPPAPTTVH